MSASAARFFDAIAPRYDRVYARAPEERARSRAALERLLPAASKVLDLGVGTGAELPALLDAGHAPVGFDISSAMLALCGKRARPIPLVEGDLWARLPWDDGAFDAVIALHGTLAHPPSDEARRGLPREVARILRPGGVFVAELPTVAWLAEASRIARSGVVSFGDGRGRFVDEVTGTDIDVWLAPEDEWRQWCEGLLSLAFEGAGNGEMRIVGRR